jgi:hypothetical protein
MKKELIILFVLFPIIIIGCTNPNIQTQEIKGPSDCDTTMGWSWNSGTAHAGRYIGDLTFQAEINGELTLKYNIDHWTLEDETRDGYLAIYADNELMFSQHEVTSGYKNASLGSVLKGAKIRLVGISCYIKNIIITGNMEEEAPSQKWDF